MGVIDGFIAKMEEENDLESRIKDLKAENGRLRQELDNSARFNDLVAHELKTPIQVVGGYLEILGDENLPYTERKLYLGIITRNIEDLTRSINDARNISKIQHNGLSIEQVNLSELAINVSKWLKESNKDYRTATFIVDENIIADADKVAIKFVLGNLISNALKYSKEKPNPEVKFGVKQQEGGEPLYYLSDNGTGMSNPDRLFIPFERQHENTQYEGMGLGLYITLKMIDLHKGQIWAESEVGKGATFYFTLPKHQS